MFSGAATALIVWWLGWQVPPSKGDPPPAQPAGPAIAEHVEVIALTPIHGLGVAEHKVAANVQVFTAADLESPNTGGLPAMLAARAASVQLSEVQSGTFQPDVLFRGFAASPLLGASEGIAVYQDGVRLNEPFGDTVHWDGIPSRAIASLNVIPGSNPLFGLNSLGGALSLQTKDGFTSAGHGAVLTTGAFGRRQLEAESAGHSDRLSYFVAGTLTNEEGWRDFSPSRIRRLFGDLGWRGATHAVHLSVTAASNSLTGNGPAPPALLERDRRAVFTHPDRTDHDLSLVTLRGRRQVSARTLLQAVGYYRGSTIGTFNGDLADIDHEDIDDEDDEDEDHHGDEPEAFTAVNNVSRSRSRGAGVTAQLTRTAALLGRENHLLGGAGLDSAATRFSFASEWAELTSTRGTVGAGAFDEDASVGLNSRTATASAFVANIWSPRPRLAVSSAARVNWTSVRLHDRIGTALSGSHRFLAVNPAVGLTWTMAGANLYASYSQSSRVPTPVELTCADPDDPCRLPNAFVSDPPLRQVVARTWEAGTRGTVDAVRWRAAVFATDADDDIIFVSSGQLRGEGHFENVSRTRRRGLEASVELSLDRLRGFAAYTWQRATFGTSLRIASPHHPRAVRREIPVQAGDRLPGIPAHLAKLGAALSLSSSLNASVTARAQSGSFLRGDEANLQGVLPPFAALDARLRQRVTRHVAIVAHAINLLDARYYTFGILGDAALPGHPNDDPRFYSPGAPRAAWIGVDLRF